jgi:hypothetical protein
MNMCRGDVPVKEIVSSFPFWKNHWFTLLEIAGAYWRPQEAPCSFFRRNKGVKSNLFFM